MHAGMRSLSSSICGLVLFVICTFAPPLRATPAPPIPTMTAVENSDPETATRAWLDTVPAEQRARSDAYFEGGYWLILWDFLMGAAISILLLATGASARMRDFAERTTRGRRTQIMLYAIPFLIANAVLGFPLNVYENFFREHQYGLATQTFAPWFREQMIGFAVTAIIVTLVLMALYAALRRMPRTWWIWGAGGAVIFILFGDLLAPVYIEPLFNSYKPLDDPAVRDPILAMARANEIPVQQILKVDASRQTTRVSANVSGFLGTTRIALNDNLLKQCTLPEIRSVMAHEMGHYVLNHNVKLALYSGLIILIGFGFVGATFQVVLRKWGGGWGVRGVDDLAGLPLLALLFSVVLFVLTPVRNTMVRVTEREADAFGINTAREPDGMAKVALKLGTYRKLNPGPLEEFIFFDHPSGRARIRMAMDWKAARLPAGNSE
jgi:STE24 endopeptidase